MARGKSKHGNKLDQVHKSFLVQRLAMYDSPKEAAVALAQEYGITITPQSAEHYDPMKRAGKYLAAHLREQFESHRKQFLETLEGIPHANMAVRIRKLGKAADLYEDRNNYVSMAAMLEQISKEVGKVYTNRHEHSGPGGGPIKYQDMSDEQVDRELAQLMHEEEAPALPAPLEAPADATRH